MKRKRDAVHNDSDDAPSEQEHQSGAVGQPRSLTRLVSPPPTLRRKSTQSQPAQTKSITAQVEAGEKDVEDHLLFFSNKLLSVTRPALSSIARIDHASWVGLYEANNLNPAGHHFVIHQHDHPVAGTHYDLRLQCNATSSVSWAIMYGLPGNPNSRRQIRNATETRIHCLWNHLVETASHQTGTLLIWDTGEYEVLPYRSKSRSSSTASHTDSASDIDDTTADTRDQWSSMSEPEKLHHSFQARRIRLRLHGTRLPENYTLSLWLRRRNDRTEQPTAPKTRRRKTGPAQPRTPPKTRPRGGDEYQTESDPSSDADLNQEPNHTDQEHDVRTLQRHESPQLPKLDTKKEEEEITRLTNAYPGAQNSIHSIHQRRWYLCLDRARSGFTRARDGVWTQQSPLRRGQEKGFTPFHVRGREHERSVVTGRVAAEVLEDEGVVGYVPRAGWRAVLE